MMDLEGRSLLNFIQLTINLNVAQSYSLGKCNPNTSGKEWTREAVLAQCPYGTHDSLQ